MRVMTEELRRKLSEAGKKSAGRTVSEATKRQISESRKKLYADGQLGSNRKIRDVPTIDVEDSFGYWLAGFCDGEGCFHASERPQNGGVRTSFSLALRIDDRSVLADILSKLRIGSLCEGSSTTTRYVRWSVTAGAHLMALVHFFRRYPLRSKKLLDFQNWASVVEYVFNHPTGARHADVQRTLDFMKQYKRGETA